MSAEVRAGLGLSIRRTLNVCPFDQVRPYSGVPSLCRVSRSVKQDGELDPYCHSDPNKRRSRTTVAGFCGVGDQIDVIDDVDVVPVSVVRQRLVTYRELDFWGRAMFRRVRIESSVERCSL